MSDNDIADERLTYKSETQFKEEATDLLERLDTLPQEEQIAALKSVVMGLLARLHTY